MSIPSFFRESSGKFFSREKFRADGSVFRVVLHPEKREEKKLSSRASFPVKPTFSTVGKSPWNFSLNFIHCFLSVLVKLLKILFVTVKFLLFLPRDSSFPGVKGRFYGEKKFGGLSWILHFIWMQPILSVSITNEIEFLIGSKSIPNR